MYTHSQLNLLSQLTALPLPVAPEALPIRVSEMVAVHRRHCHALAGDAAMTAEEWRCSLELLQADPALMRLRILAQADEPRNGLYGLCFGSDSPDWGIITFRGTVGLGGWIDNYRGAFLAETAQQRAAFEFYKGCRERFGFSRFDLAGHSKGGNDAQYITILDGDCINQCVTFNSPGFSADFIAKYQGLIQKNQDKITAYEGAYDIVNILLTSIAGRRFVIETGSKAPKNNHKPNQILDPLGRIGLPGERHPLYTGIQNMTVAMTFALFRAKRNLRQRNKKTAEAVKRFKK